MVPFLHSISGNLSAIEELEKAFENDLIESLLQQDTKSQGSEIVELTAWAQGARRFVSWIQQRAEALDLNE